jgi:hypothetical protein
MITNIGIAVAILLLAGALALIAVANHWSFSTFSSRVPRPCTVERMGFGLLIFSACLMAALKL